ncbi:MAG: hypothetical protein K2G07_01790 [Muribaculaceae bacterium]|nr:hypothetical protein [Muribaculaceae bacterium]
MNNTALKALIDKYFDGLTSDAEEAALRKALASPEVKGEDADEARAVLGVFAAQRSTRHTGGARLIRRAAAAAAVVIALAIGAWKITAWNSAPDEAYLAYVNGTRIDQSEPVLAIMAEELSAIGEAESSVQEEFNEILLIL